MNRVLALLILVSCLIFCQPAKIALAETPGSMAKEAQSAYETGDYRLAIQKWQELLNIGYINGNLFYNLGNAAWQMGEGGKARWFYLKGLQLDPRNSRIQNNLKFIEAKLDLRGKQTDEGPLTLIKNLPWWKFSLSFYETLKLGGVLSLLFFGYLFLKKLKKNKKSKILVWGLGVPWAVFIILGSWKAYQFYFNRDAVVLTSGAPLLTAPTTEATSGENAVEGALVSIKKKQGDFKLVKTPQGKEAWIEAAQLGEIRL